ncbi:MAG: hypothetical protein XU10_C0026G0022 [Chloroflexi bacterium CSP1-4]|nr:MAG: hypothetical protein XU10_C0026G0022 [Chloroflexi bacterium CSP1-4]
MADGVDAGDAEHVGEDRVARAAAPLGRDAPLAGEAHEVPADEEELGQAGALDDVELVGELLDDGGRHGLIALPRSLVAEPLEDAEGRLPPGHGEAGEAVALEAEVDAAAGAELSGRPQPLRPGPTHDRRGTRLPRRQRGQLRRGLQVELPVGTAQMAALLERQAVADGDQDVLQLAVLRARVVGVVGDHDRQPQLGGQGGRLPGEEVVVGQEMVLELEEEAAADPLHRRIERRVPAGHRGGPGPIAGQQPPGDLAVAAAGERHEPLCVALQERLREAWHALRARQVRRADHPAQAAVAGQVAGQQDEVRPPLAVAHPPQLFPSRVPMPRRPLPLDGRAHRPPLDGRGRPGRGHRAPCPPSRHDDARGIRRRGVEQLDLQSDDRPQARLLCHADETDGAVEAPVVGHREGVEAQLERPGDEVVGARGPVEEREVRVRMELGEGCRGSGHGAAPLAWGPHR